MAVGRPAKVIRVKVPRHNSQRIGTKLGAEIKKLSRSQKIRTDISQPTHEIAQAIESASEWNSLLITARAERGPQWDVGTQQFHVDNYSSLHYDPTLLLEAVKKFTEAEQGDDQQQPHHPLPPQLHQSNSRHHTPRRDDYHMSNSHHPMGPPGHDPSMQHRHHPPPANYPYPATPNMNMNMNMNMRGPGPAPRQYPAPPGPRGAPFNTAAPGQFYPNDAGSPMRMGGMGGMGMMDHNPGLAGPPIGGIPGGMGMGWDMGGSSMQAMPVNRRMDEFPMH